VEFNDADPATEFQVAVELVDDEPMIVVTGEVDLAVVDRLWGCMSARVAAGGPVVLDFSGVSFIDSSGVNLLVRAYQDLGGRADAVVVRAPSPQVRRVLELSGADDYVTVVPAGGVTGPEGAAGSDGSEGSDGAAGS
jgi:stage II sporulation protein AA (anti-sigma F factor antagonist)